MLNSARGVFLGLIVVASLGACSLPGFASGHSPAQQPASAAVSTIEVAAENATTTRQKLQDLVEAGEGFTAAGVDLTAFTAAMNTAELLLREDYLTPESWPTADYVAARSALENAMTDASAQRAVIVSAMLAAEAESARLAAIQAAAVAQSAALSRGQRAAQSGSSLASASTPSVYELRVAGVAHNQAEFDSCRLMDASEWMGARLIAAHWTCAHGSAIPRQAGQLFAVTGAGALNGNYVSIGIVGTLNQKTQTTKDIPHNYDLIVVSCLNNDSTHMMMLVLNRIP